MATTGKCAADIITRHRQEALWRYFEASGGGAEEVVKVLSDISHYSTGVRGQRDSCKCMREANLTVGSMGSIIIICGKVGTKYFC